MELNEIILDKYKKIDEKQDLSKLSDDKLKIDVIEYIKSEAKTQGFYGQFLQKHLSNDKDINTFISIMKKQKISSHDELDTFLSKNSYFRNKDLSDINEKQDLSKFASTIADMTDKNQHMESFLLIATLLEDKRLIEVVKAINNIHDYESDITPIYKYKRSIEEKIHKLGRKKYGDDWKTYVEDNM